MSGVSRLTFVRWKLPGTYPDPCRGPTTGAPLPALVPPVASRRASRGPWGLGVVLSWPWHDDPRGPYRQGGRLAPGAVASDGIVCVLPSVVVLSPPSNLGGEG